MVITMPKLGLLDISDSEDVDEVNGDFKAKVGNKFKQRKVKRSDNGSIKRKLDVEDIVMDDVTDDVENETVFVPRRKGNGVGLVSVETEVRDTLGTTKMEDYLKTYGDYETYTAEPKDNSVVDNLDEVEGIIIDAESESDDDMGVSPVETFTQVETNMRRKDIVEALKNVEFSEDVGSDIEKSGDDSDLVVDEGVYDTLGEEVKLVFQQIPSFEVTLEAAKVKLDQMRKLVEKTETDLAGVEKEFNRIQDEQNLVTSEAFSME